MRVTTPRAEKKAIEAAIRPALRRLRDPDALANFLDYAYAKGAHRLLFGSRLAKVLRGEPAPAFIVALLLTWAFPIPKAPAPKKGSRKKAPAKQR